MVRYHSHTLDDGRKLSVADSDDILDEGFHEFMVKQNKAAAMALFILGVVIAGLVILR